MSDLVAKRKIFNDILNDISFKILNNFSINFVDVKIENINDYKIILLEWNKINSLIEEEFGIDFISDQISDKLERKTKLKLINYGIFDINNFERSDNAVFLKKFGDWFIVCCDDDGNWIMPYFVMIPVKDKLGNKWIFSPKDAGTSYINNCSRGYSIARWMLMPNDKDIIDKINKIELCRKEMIKTNIKIHSINKHIPFSKEIKDNLFRKIDVI